MPYCTRPVKGEEDLRCPIEPAEQLSVALKQKRREVRFVRFPGEHHERSRSRKPSHRLQRFDNLLDWCAEKLAAPAEPVSEAASSYTTAHDESKPVGHW